MRGRGNGRPHAKEKFVDKHRVVVNVGEANTSCIMGGQNVETGDTCECEVSKLGIIISNFSSRMRRFFLEKPGD